MKTDKTLNQRLYPLVLEALQAHDNNHELVRDLLDWEAMVECGRLAPHEDVALGLLLKSAQLQTMSFEALNEYQEFNAQYEGPDDGRPERRPIAH